VLKFEQGHCACARDWCGDVILSEQPRQRYCRDRGLVGFGNFVEHCQQREAVRVQVERRVRRARLGGAADAGRRGARSVLSSQEPGRQRVEGHHGQPQLVDYAGSPARIRTKVSACARVLSVPSCTSVAPLRTK
jgi:hypothetical protein